MIKQQVKGFRIIWFTFLIPELHRIKYENISMGLYSSQEGTGVAIKWQPKF